MDVLIQSNQNYLNILGPNNPNPDKKHRFLTYLVYYDIDNGKAIWNTLTGAFIWIPYDQFNNIFNKVEVNDYIKFLWRNYFVVNEDFDEQTCQQNLKDKFKRPVEDQTYLKSGHIKEYTMFTTMACNARCSYCYEKGRPQVPMKSETARKVADYIIKTAVKNGETISLRWFGGEPLVNENVIDIICEKVKDAGFNYVSSFTTNGFLIKEDKLKKYKDLWHFVNCQITLDGTEEVYNEIKNYKNIKGKSPYQIVMNNIELLISNDIRVIIRMNTTKDNADNLKDLIKELYNRFGHNKNLSMYAYPIFEDHDNPRNDEQNAILFKKVEELDNVLDQYGYLNKNEYSSRVRSTHCMIDNGYAVVIGTQGDIGLCEHYSEEHFWGHIDKPELKDINEIKRFKEYEPDLDICKTCSYLPQCIRPKLCVDLRECNKYKKKWIINGAIMSVRDMYLKIRTQQQQQQPQQCNNCNNNFNTYENNQNNQCNQNNINNENINKLGFFEKLKIKFGLK